MDKSPWDTYVMQQIICVLQLKFEKKALLSVQKYVATSPPPPPLPTQYNVEIQVKPKVLVFNIQ